MARKTAEQKKQEAEAKALAEKEAAQAAAEEQAALEAKEAEEQAEKEAAQAAAKEAEEKAAKLAQDPISKVTGAVFPEVSCVEASICGSMVSDYVCAMATNQMMSEAVGARHQAKLNDAIYRILRLPEEDFKSVMDWFLAVIAKNKTGCFGIHYAMRFISSMTFLSTNQRQNFERLLHLFTSTADVKSRGLALKQINLDHVTRYTEDNGPRERIMSYFS
ncbi:hypothetical protein [Endozoicomonas sp. ONNA1]|uniref:hypothetical protein n=1 Tax=Endozoicomonas sp. ONNA1 TaxID=2828740 RepID=UPI0021494A90|nr:hypothetical protein [Endozoicomonas sp. ONNA1]